MNARALALAALAEWRKGRQFADAVLQTFLARSRLTGSDRGFATELFYGVLRNLTLLDFWIAQLRSADLDDETRDLLRLGIYQIAFLNTASHAAVNETVTLAPPRARGLTNAILRNAQRRRAELEGAAAKAPRHVRLSHPEFLVRKWDQQFGPDATLELCLWNNRPAPIYVRVNELQISVSDFLQKYAGAVVVPENNRFVTLPEPWAAVAAGDGYVQDPSTTVAPELLASGADETVLDACAAPGGKTGYIAQLMQNRGTLVACDRDARRLEVLRQNLQTLGVRNAQVVQHDWSKDSLGELSRFQFDRVLIDAPCSNTGVMRRRVDVRWRLQPGDFTRMPDAQLEIVRAALPLLKPGGVLVYSTCSIEPEENDRVIEGLLREFPFMRRDEEKSMLPFRDHFDGAFAAKVVRDG